MTAKISRGTRDELLNAIRQRYGKARTLGITCLMSRTGNCYDNAVAERFL